MLPRILFIKISQATILLPVFEGLKSYKYLTAPFRLLLYFFLSTIIFEVQASIAGKLYHNNMPGLHLFTLTEFLVFSTVYYRFFRERKLLAAVIAVNALVFMVLALTDALYIHDIWTINRLARSYSSISMLCYTLIYFYFIFSREDLAFTSRHPMFWVNIGALVYFGSNALYFMVSKDLIAMGSFASKIGLCIHGGLNIIANFLYARSFRCFRPKTVS